MDFIYRKDSALINSLRYAYHVIRGSYRQTRALKNRLLNLADCPLIILIYHRVTSVSIDPEMISVTPENFRGQLEYLKQKYQVLGFGDEWTGLQQPAVVVTFDDGYADNVEQALPILEEFQVPATFFISSGNLGLDTEFWWHRLEKLMLQEGPYPESFSLHDETFGGHWATRTGEQRKMLYLKLSQLMRKIDGRRQDHWLEQLEGWAPTPPAGEGLNRVMSHQQLQSLVESPVATIGAHTVSHVALSALPEEQQRAEIFNSKKKLEDLTNTSIKYFSYPFGRKVDYDRISVQLCRDAGFLRVASNFPGQVHRWTDHYQLPRHLVRNWDVQTFATELQKFWTR